ncbi:MAG: tetratricopeptide repeat protein [Phycisphaerales bacterium]|nr:tetratricopeptide repeat protein [Phycisphaerales bacterium]
MQQSIDRFSMHRAAGPALAVLAVGLFLPACATHVEQPVQIRGYEPRGVAPADAVARGGYSRVATTTSPEAQEWFNRGMFLCFAFDHEQAAVAFEHALTHDPDMAMAYWGIAWSSGPNINNIMMDDARNRAAFAALTKAKARAAGCSPVEQALINALDKRYAEVPPADRRTLDEAFADAMREVHADFPADPDASAIFAESLMALYPWDIWSPTGEPRPITLELVGVLEGGLRRSPQHIGLAHAYIHTMEASTSPGKADGAADLLRTKTPGAPHLVHMPSHIDIRQGRYENAVLANQRAIRADRVRTQEVGPGGFFAVYRAHNAHFLQYAAMFDGQRRVALEAARNAVATLPPEVVDAFPLLLEGFLAAPYHAMIRFGMWEEILTEPAPGANRPVTAATHFYARGIALAALGRVEEARTEQALFLQAYEVIPADAYIGNNAAKTVLAIGKAMLEGEIQYRSGNTASGFAALRDAVAQNDALRYDEPWGWMQPPRHALGALLLEQGQIEQAQAVYQTDLQYHPKNGWALRGLAECYERSGDAAARAATLAQAQAAWARSDIPLTVSCLCRNGKVGQP